MDDMRELIGAYVLDALDEGERTAFEAYLADHPEMQAEVDELRVGATLLAEQRGVTPPPSMRAAVLETVGSVKQVAVERPPVVVTPGRRRRWLALAGAVALVVVLVVGVTALRSDEISDVYAAPDAVELDLAADEFGATFTYSFELQQGVFASTELPGVSADETYQLWLIDDAGPMPAGLFRPDDGDAEVLVSGELTRATLLGLTIEPAGGSAAPTGDILIAEPLDASA